MAITSDNDADATVPAVVTIRVPSGADGDLVTDAEERLSRAEGIADVTIDELYDIDPRLSATVVTVGVVVQPTTALTEAELRERLADGPGLSSVERIGKM